MTADDESVLCLSATDNTCQQQLPLICAFWVNTSADPLVLGYFMFRLSL